MLPKPKHLGPEYASQFQDRSVVAAYHLRPPYPEEVFDILTELITDEPRAVLDAGCGTGEIGRRLVDRVDRIDAVDWSQAMVERGQGLPGGDHPSLRWIAGRVEEVPLCPPYALVVTAASLHWMDWEVVLPRFRAMLTPRGCLAIVPPAGASSPPPWAAELSRIFARFSTNRDYTAPYDLVQELAQLGLFEKHGERTTAPVPFTQSLDEYLESIHSRNGFSRERMGAESAAAFDAEARRLVSAHCERYVEMDVVANVTWGQPAPLHSYSRAWS